MLRRTALFVKALEPAGFRAGFAPSASTYDGHDQHACQGQAIGCALVSHLFAASPSTNRSASAIE